MIEQRDYTRHVQVSFRKSLTDGNYGTEAAEVSLDWFINAEQEATDDQRAAEQMLQAARLIVHEELGKSPSLRVRRGLTPPKVTVDDDADFEVSA